nr:MAG TPA: helix-turn-helix domain protein [Bacteriophage sp.]
MNEIQDIKNELVVYTLGQLEATKIERELVGQRIKQVRKQCGLTMIEFGKALNVTNVTVCRWENGQRIPNVFKILEIAKMGNMTVEEFLS